MRKCLAIVSIIVLLGANLTGCGKEKVIKPETQANESMQKHAIGPAERIGEEIGKEIDQAMDAIQEKLQSLTAAGGPLEKATQNMESNVKKVNEPSTPETQPHQNKEMQAPTTPPAAEQPQQL